VAHLSLYHAIAVTNGERKVNKTVGEFRKNVYSKEIRDFVIAQIKTGIITKHEAIAKYNLPKTTVYNWMRKYSPN
jgi:transposase-like protein